MNMRSRLKKQFEDFKASYNEYPRCLDDSFSEKDEMIHFLMFHRWYTKLELIHLFPKSRVSTIEKTPSKCHPTIDGRQLLTRRAYRMKENFLKLINIYEH